MGWEAPKGGKESMEDKREHLTREEEDSDKAQQLAVVKKALFERFNKGGEEISGTLKISDSGILQFEDASSKEAAGAPLLILFAAGVSTPEEFMEVARKIQDDGIAEFSFEKDKNGRTLSYTIKPID